MIKVRSLHSIYILSGSSNKCWLHTCHACVITTWRLGLLALLVARKHGKRTDLKRLNNELILVDWVLVSLTNFFPPENIFQTFCPKPNSRNIKLDFYSSNSVGCP